ncbi:hypothetical protein KSP40_PGU004965 [Platanthera guangdongensis]|uniref:Uncharacterized protein n=1 Tax=Platanthera guangdongensis TaxID=2320717 RepID=A0ABR2MJV4_9ASPA
MSSSAINLLATTLFVENKFPHLRKPVLRKSNKLSTAVHGIAAFCHRRPENPGSQNGLPLPAGFFARWKISKEELRERVEKLGLAAVLAYGIFDGATYSTFFVLAFLGYEKSTGKNPAANLQALLGIVALMWTGNNVTRPFRIAGAAALAPIVDRELKRIQSYLKLPNLFLAFALVAGLVASSCLAVVGLLILSRWGK